MKLEELANNRYIKTTDSVEKYLLEIIKKYFESSNIDTDNREYIIKKAVARMKEELDIDNAGVLSVNGKTGDVTITLEELGGEPAIVPKNSAFNVDFGDQQNTACEGNDPRLSDARKPLRHTHETEEINGLDAELARLRNSIDNLAPTKHTHDNKDVLDKLIYTGVRAQIDLTIIDTIEDELARLRTDVQDTINTNTRELTTLKTRVVEELQAYINAFEGFKTYVNTENIVLKNSLQEYCNTVINNIKTTLENEIADKATKAYIDQLQSLYNNQYSLYKSYVYTGILQNASLKFTKTYTGIPTDEQSFISSLNQDEFFVECYMQYYIDGVKHFTKLPIYYSHNNSISFVIQISTVDNIPVFNGLCNDESWPSFVNNAIFAIRYYVKNNKINSSYEEPTPIHVEPSTPPIDF